MPKYSKAQIEEARAQMLKWLKPGDTVHTILDHVSSSGMSRNIRVVILRDGEAIHPNHSVSVLLGLPRAKHGDGMRIGGCGSDMGFEIVYNLGRKLFPDGFGVKSVGGIVPTSKEHAAQLVAEGKTSFSGRNRDDSGWDNDGGYALKHRWL